MLLGLSVPQWTDDGHSDTAHAKPKTTQQTGFGGLDESVVRIRSKR